MERGESFRIEIATLRTTARRQLGMDAPQLCETRDPSGAKSGESKMRKRKR